MDGAKALSLAQLGKLFALSGAKIVGWHDAVNGVALDENAIDEMIRSENGGSDKKPEVGFRSGAQSPESNVNGSEAQKDLNS